MNVFEKLLKADAAKADELETKVIKSRRLAHILGEKDPVDITIRALPTRDVQYIQEYTTDKNGNEITGRYVDACFIACTMGIVEPDVSSEELISHFGAKDSKALVEKLFQMEGAAIAAEIMELSGGDINVKDEIKN